MSITMTHNAKSAAEDRTQPLGNFKLAAGVTLAVLALMVFWRIFQQVYAWSAGLDSTEPAFDAAWMTLLKVELSVIPLLWVVTWAYLWFTRDRNLGALKPREELRRYFNLVLFNFVYAFCVWFATSFFAEQDASWHQVVVRDTSFTPSHIVLFYGTMPLYVLFGVGSFLYAMTRLPKFATQISIPFVLAVVGPFLILPNLGYNEWGHAFFLMEEVFSYPLHWGFVVMGWSVLALGGLLIQIAMHMLEVIGRLSQEDQASVATQR
ncbi:bacterial ammonia monooxygenase, subunit AmoC [Bradyrhizobium niftali]|jgi:methane/ammonia monooxygenase subunit C|uniref:Methane monooxygenase/ammonia monooxygenase subunit C n=1 Tax=Bradyrhizobium niftali TaxID=2560055 RepID=A0A4Y9L6P1_9BRAD|nr:bacterial ammonia monooxygenase, subunit AmoC [Bradyrhizobium niftali]TFV39085.1 methane monooxygenase/ammonia monooxygenase subunit C [Bradyrhizobium niftali]